MKGINDIVEDGFGEETRKEIFGDAFEKAPADSW
jgi:hypothetical protein